jgi:hypothetical protein
MMKAPTHPSLRVENSNAPVDFSTGIEHLTDTGVDR